MNYRPFSAYKKVIICSKIRMFSDKVLGRYDRTVKKGLEHLQSIFGVMTC